MMTYFLTNIYLICTLIQNDYTFSKLKIYTSSWASKTSRLLVINFYVFNLLDNVKKKMMFCEFNLFEYNFFEDEQNNDNSKQSYPTFSIRFLWKWTVIKLSQQAAESSGPHSGAVVYYIFVSLRKLSFSKIQFFKTQNGYIFVSV
jgi:hypothetical protein